MDRFVGSALDSQPWGTVHVVVAVVVTVALSTLLVLVVAAAATQVAKLRGLEMAPDPTLPPVLPTLE